jgi:TPR repeat protein
MKARISIFILFSIIINGCTVTGHESLSNKKLDELKKKIIEKGDHYAYVRLGNYYSDQNRSYELLPYSLILEYKFNNEMVTTNSYNELLATFTQKQYNEGEDFAKLNNEERKLALYLLSSCAKKNKIGCIDELEKLYRKGIGVKKDIKKADSLKMHLDSIMYKR